MKPRIALIAAALGLSLGGTGCFDGPSAEPRPSTPPAAGVGKPEAPAVSATHSAAAAAAPAIAELRDPVADVRVRRAQELIWNAAQAGEGLANRDAVRTGAASRALVRFNDSSELKVEEQSMVVVIDKKTVDREEQARVALPSGRVQGRLKRSADHDVEMEVRTARGWIFASTRDKQGSSEPVFQVEVSPKGRLEVKSVKGTVTVRIKDGERVVRPHETLSIKEPPNPPVEADLDALPAVDAGEVQVASASGAARPPKKATAVSDSFEILRPANRAEIPAESATIEGKLTGRLKAYLNGKEVRAKPDGTFSVAARLVPGTNLLTFQVIGPAPKDVRYKTLELIRRAAPSDE